MSLGSVFKRGSGRIHFGFGTQRLQELEPCPTHIVLAHGMARDTEAMGWRGVCGSGIGWGQGRPREGTGRKCNERHVGNSHLECDKARETSGGENVKRMG